MTAGPLTLTSLAVGALFALLAAGLGLTTGPRWAAKWAAAAALLTGGPAVAAAATGFDLDDPARRAEVLFQAVLFNLAALGGVAGLGYLDRRTRR